MRVFVTGASGLIGSRLCARLCDSGHEVVGLSRGGGGRGDAHVRWVQGDPAVRGPWTEEVASADGVIHLAGESVAGRWTAARKLALASSRIDSTRIIVDALAEGRERGERVFVCASAAGYYGSRGDERLSEDAAPGDDFLARLCVDWEAEAARAEASGCRVASLRFGIVLSPEGGALANMLPIFKLGLGGPLASADAWFPWVALDDAVALSAFALEHPVSGPLNVVAPEPERMGSFAKVLGRVLGRPVFAPTVPAFVLQLALGEFGAHVVPGQCIEPAAALRAGFAFATPGLEAALRAVLDR